MERLDGVTAIALVVIASFAIDRIVSGSLFLLSYSKAWSRRFPEPSSVEDEATRVRVEKTQKLVYFALAGFLGMVVLAGAGNVRILSALVVQPAQSESAIQSSQPKTSTQPAQAGSSNQGDAPTKPEAKTGSLESKSGLTLFSILDIVFTGLLLMGGADRPGDQDTRQSRGREVRFEADPTVRQADYRKQTIASPRVRSRLASKLFRLPYCAPRP